MELLITGRADRSTASVPGSLVLARSTGTEAQAEQRSASRAEALTGSSSASFFPGQAALHRVPEKTYLHPAKHTTHIGRLCVHRLARLKRGPVPKQEALTSVDTAQLPHSAQPAVVQPLLQTNAPKTCEGRFGRRQLQIQPSCDLLSSLAIFDSRNK